MTPAPLDCAAFVAAMIRTATLAGDLTSADAPFASPDFVAVYENPAPHAPCAAALAADPATPRLHRRLAALAMQRLPLDAYLDFVAPSAAGRRSGALGVDALVDLLLPGVEWGRRITGSADDPRVADLLRTLAAEPELDPPRRGYLAHLLGGAP